MDEWTFINWLREHAGRRSDPRVKVGIGDDMAILDLAGQTVLLGSDMLVEGIHFDLGKVSARQIGRKALGVCLSDCAAMAAEPSAALVSFSKPKSMPVDVLQQFYEGLVEIADEFDCPLVGGDSCAGSDQLVVDVALLAVSNGVGPVLRSGAIPGDWLYVTGKLGGSILEKHFSFVPRIREARRLTANLPVHAMIDLSDGMSVDVQHLCRESHCGAELTETLLENVISPAARQLSDRTGRSPLDHALNDGEDFELLVAIGLAPQDVPALPEKTDLFPVGKVIDAQGVHLVTQAGTRRPVPPRGYRHF